MSAQGSALGHGRQQDPKPRRGEIAPMPQSLARIVVHLVFSTKYRSSLLADPALRRELEAYLAAVLKGWDSPAILIGAVSDHVHLLHQLSKNHPASKIVEEVK